MSKAKRWCWTLNNPTRDEEAYIVDHADTFDYIVFGRETGESGTPHLQGYVICKSRLRLNQIKPLLCQRAHFEVSRGTPKQASDYCKKDNDFFEQGQLPETQGKRNDFERLRDWCKECDVPPTHFEIANEFPSLWGRYRSACVSFVDLFAPKPQLCDGQLREWQQGINDKLNEDPDDRKVMFVVDPIGGKGKSWFTRYLFTKRDDVQRLSIGKRDDLAYAIDCSKRLFIFDIPRGQLQYLQYNVLEQLKDQMVFSPKYESTTKILSKVPHVLVFTNEEPDYEMMTSDRYDVYRP